ncbi:MAG: Eco57I restriction-modification methylase domain-containing protein [Bdellovibrionales bacterium]|nr:Eco57I restriction-modification methylase domain-containing protein [Bdellovibrionales bacterium]
MSVQLKLANVNTHVVDILGSVKGRDQPVMKMDKAVELVKCLEEKVFINEDYVFFDPFCKAGEILLSAALVTTLYKSKDKLVLLDTVYKEMYQSNRYFALAPDERHYNLSLRTFYGNEKSHDKNFTGNIKNGAYLSEIDGRLNEEKFNKELKVMLEYIKEKTENKKIIAVGNPPYQEEDGGFGKSAKPIYNILIEGLISSKKIDKFSLVIPARWFSGGKWLDNFRNHMIQNKQIKKITYFENSSHIFPTVDIRGGVCFLYWDKMHSGKTTIKNREKVVTKDISDWDIIVPHVEAYSIIDKILQKSDTFVSEIVWSSKPFGLRTFYFRKNTALKSDNQYAIPCYSSGNRVLYADRRDITKNRNRINEYQVAFPEASGGGKGHRDKVLLRPGHFFILNKGQISTETYSIAGSFTTRKEAKNFLSFLQTNFARFLLGLRKPTQHTKAETFNWVPLMSTKKSWTDEELFKHFNINSEEQKYIIEQVERWTA